MSIHEQNSSSKLDHQSELIFNTINDGMTAAQPGLSAPRSSQGKRP
jgi:hypothetical protein